MVIKYLDEDIFYDTFQNELIEIMGLHNFNTDNPVHVKWLQNRIRLMYMTGGRSMCLYSDYDMPLCFILFTYDKGLEGVFANTKAEINLLAVKEHHRGKGYGSLLIRELEKHLISMGAESIQVDTNDNKDERRAITFYIKNGFTPIACYPDGQIHLYKHL